MSESSKSRLWLLLALTAALVIPSLLPQSARGMYDPKHGRWLQRDPAGYVDGSNLYQYVKSQPYTKVDPSGRGGVEPRFLVEQARSLKTRTLDRFQREIFRLMKYDYAKIFGITGGFVRANVALNNIPIGDTTMAQWVIDEEPRYIWFWDRIYPPWDADPGTIFHEGIHAYHDQTGTFGNTRDTEGIATAAEFIYRASEVFKLIEKYGFKGSPCWPKKMYSDMWGDGWKRLNDVIGTPPSMFPNAMVSRADIVNVRLSLGILPKCQDLAARYNTRIQQLPRRCWPCQCLRFVCRRAKPFPQGVLEIGTKEEVDMAYGGSKMY
jgi:hypothetical protein